MHAIGIDLGTTHSCVGVWQHDNVVIIANDQGNRRTPSYVAFTDTEQLIGDAAKNQVVLNPSNTVFDAKRLIGRKFKDPKLQAEMKHWPFTVINDCGKPKIQVEFKGETKRFAPEDITSMILTKMTETAEAYLGTTVNDAVIAVPAYFNLSQRRATKKAAVTAGLNEPRLINELTAAAITYSLDKNLMDEREVLIFHSGSATIDVSIFSIQNGTLFEVRATSSDTHLGGDDFDNRLVDHLAEEFQRKYKKDLRTNPRALRRLRTAAERAKCSLSSSTEASVEILAIDEGVDFSTFISRARFEELNADLFRGTLQPVEKALQDAKMDKSEIDDVVVVGGSTRIPKVQSLLQNFFCNKELNVCNRSDEAVTYGAAVLGAVLSTESHPKVEAIFLLDMVTVSLGVKTADGGMTKILDRDCRIPCRESRIFTTHSNNQPGVTIQVYEGESASAQDNKLQGRFCLTGIPSALRGVLQIEVTFEIDEDNCLYVSAREKSTGRSKSLKVSSKLGLDVAADKLSEAYMLVALPHESDEDEY